MKRRGGENEALSEALKDPDRFVSVVFSGQIRVTKTLLKTSLCKSGSASFAQAAVKRIEQGLECLDGASGEAPDTEANAGSFKTPSPPRRKRKRQGADPELQKQGCSSGISSGRKQILSGLRSCVLLLQVGLAHCRKAFQPRELLPVVQNLHDRLVGLEDDPELQDGISELCELWWREGFDGKESLIAQSLPFLMSRSLTSNRKVDVHRVHALREAFTLFDFLDVSIEDLKHLLIRSVVTPLFLRAAEGRRFVSFLFRLSPQLVKELNALMHSQIPFGRKSILEAYGEILYRAWKGASGACLAEIENSCVQGLLEGAIYASSKTLGSACRKVLEGFISQRAEAGVEAMLFRLQEPILFRSLQVANSNVRRNAVLLLIDMFPLQEPDASKEEKELLFEKQFSLIEKLLQDPCPDVRSTTVEGACRVLRLFWEVVPSTITAKLLTKIVDDMPNDQSSNATRLAVLEGITYLLENSQSHEILKVLLPRISPMLNDPAVTVRTAAVDLLLVVRDIRGIPFHKVARLDFLLSILASDCDSVARRLTNLLIPSYFPIKSSVVEACNRCCTLIKRSPMAGARFCSLISAEGVPAESLFELLKFLCNLALSKSDLGDDHQEGVVLAISELGSAMAGSGKWRLAVGDHLTGEMLMALLKAAVTPRARTSVVRLASCLPPKDVPELTKYCGDLVMSSAKDPESCDEIRAVNSFVLAWGGFDDLVHALLGTLSRFCQALPSAEKQKGSSKKKTKSGKTKTRSSPRQTSFRGTLNAAVGAAWHVQTLLAENDTRKALLSCGVLQDLLASLKYLAEYCMKNVENITVTGLLSSTVTAYANLPIHLTLERRKDGNIRTSTGRRKRHRVDVSTTTPVSNPLDGIEGVFQELIDWTSKMIEEICGEQSSSLRRNNKQGNFLMHPCAIRLSSATLRSVLEVFNLGLSSDGALQSKAVRLATTFITAVQAGIDGEPVEENLQDLSPCLKASVSYAGKLLSVCSTQFSECSTLAHTLLDALAVIEQHESGSCYQFLSALRVWIPDALAAVGEKLELADAVVTRDWISHLATIGGDEETGTSSQEPEKASGGMNLMQIILKSLSKLSKPILQAFVGRFVQYATTCFEAGDQDRGIGSLNLVCKAILDYKLSAELQESSRTGLRGIDSKLSGMDPSDNHRLQAVRNLLTEVISTS